MHNIWYNNPALKRTGKHYTGLRPTIRSNFKQACGMGTIVDTMKSIHSEPVFCLSLNLDNRIRLMTAEKTADGAIPWDSVGKNLRKQEVLLIYDKKRKD